MQKELITVLVVDDNAATLYSTSRVLRNAGYRVVEASTGAEAIRLASGDIDLAILDINLPDIDGYEVCRRIREMKTPARLPVVHLSASFVTDHDRVYGLELGADGYITHPVEPPVLIATVNAFLRIRQAEIEREQLLANERAARAEAERANRFKDEFIATLSHELRTPLQSMLGWAQVLKFGDPTPEEIAEGVDAIERNAQLQSQMIADLLDVARITSGKLQLDARSVDLAALIAAVASDAAPTAAAKSIFITTDLSHSIDPVEGDSARLQQVVRNLVNNAIKFTPHGGKIELALCRAGANVEISVTDNGEGIAPEFLPRIFERFLQGDASTNRRHGGLGLGLAIVRQLIEMHGGSVRAESKGPGTGSRFIVQLPAADANAKATPGREASGEDTASNPADNMTDYAPATQRLDGVRVLLVDDNEDARRILSRILSACGASVKLCDGAKSALAAIKDFQPQILISDLGMPGKDGFEIIRSVRELGYSAEALPAIALTAFARSQDREQVLLSGFQLHLAKPVMPLELTAAITSLICPAAGS